MPTSLLALAPTIITYVAERARELGRPIRVLDVGVGHGKYGLLLREYLGDRLEVIDGLEAERRYFDDFPWLYKVYDVVLCEDATESSDDVFDSYDLVLMLDVLEHLDYEPAAELLRRIAAPVLISTPRDYFQNPEHLEYPTESHRSHWSAESIALIRPLDRDDAAALHHYAAVLVRCAPLEA